MERTVAVVGWSVAAVTSGTAVWALYKWCDLKRSLAHSHIDQKNQEVNKQLVHHYVDIEGLTVLKDLIPETAREYHARLAEFASNMCDRYNNTKCKILDVGSGVGGAAFALSKYFEEVIATEINPDMHIACERLKRVTEFLVPFSCEGGKRIKMFKIKRPDGCETHKISFVLEDVHVTLREYGLFDCILMSNVITEIAFPRELLLSLEQHVPPKGILIIADPYNWKAGVENRLDSFDDAENSKHMKTGDRLASLLHDGWIRKEVTSMPFYVAETERVASVASAEVSVWQRVDDLPVE